ncbi:MAG: hypothetical protein AB4057_17370 [Crocosphaera sp.]
MGVEPTPFKPISEIEEPDVLLGTMKNDFIKGGKEDDILIGGGGHNILEGGVGIDTFVIGYNDGFDTIRDFSLKQGDIIAIAEGISIESLEFIASDSEEEKIIIMDGSTGNSIGEVMGVEPTPFLEALQAGEINIFSYPI